MNIDIIQINGQIDRYIILDKKYRLIDKSIDIDTGIDILIDIQIDYTSYGQINKEILETRFSCKNTIVNNGKERKQI